MNQISTKKENNRWIPYSKASRNRHRYARENNIMAEKSASTNKLASAYSHGQNQLIKDRSVNGKLRQMNSNTLLIQIQ